MENGNLKTEEIVKGTNKTINMYFYDQSGIRGAVINGEEYYFAKDALGNVVEIARVSDNYMVAVYEYDAWGNYIVIDGSGKENTDPNFIGNLNPFRYRGYYYDTDLKMYYLQTRWYDPETGRFINLDQISYLDPETLNGLNLYSYCQNNPVMGYDPMGTDWLEELINLCTKFCSDAEEFFNDLKAKVTEGVENFKENVSNAINNGVKNIKGWIKDFFTPKISYRSLSGFQTEIYKGIAECLKENYQLAKDVFHDTLTRTIPNEIKYVWNNILTNSFLDASVAIFSLLTGLIFGSTASIVSSIVSFLFWLRQVVN